MTSGDDDTKPRRPSRSLSREDRELWQHVTKGVQRKLGTATISHEADAGDATTHEEIVAVPIFPEPSPAPKTTTPPPAPLDRRRARRIAKGHERIEARIDLHGMRQSEAHTALRGFLLRCYADGLRRVLVITGKGNTASPQDEWVYAKPERGILRSNVPRWLAEPELSAIVSATAPAHARHGGDGALYITLRRSHRNIEHD